MVVQAPSLDSIKSWNCQVAENLIKKSHGGGGETFEEDEEEEDFDPFDTSAYKSSADRKKDAADADDDVEDPFDTSAVPDYLEEEVRGFVL